MAKKRQTARRAQSATTTSAKRRQARAPGRGEQRRFGIELQPIVRLLSTGISRLERQLRVYADDPKRTRALRRSIERLQTVRAKTVEICPNEIFWFGVPVKGDKASRG